jgi:hypothetical protein
VLPECIARELERRGVDPAAYVTELVIQSIANSADRMRLYLESSEHFWREGMALAERDLRQAGEKLWNSVVQLVKAVAEAKGLRHDSHRLLWAVVRGLAAETGDSEIVKLFAAAGQLHINFYEGHLERYDFEIIRGLAAELRERLKRLLQARA